MLVFALLMDPSGVTTESAGVTVINKKEYQIPLAASVRLPRTPRHPRIPKRTLLNSVHSCVSYNTNAVLYQQRFDAGHT